MRDVPNSARTSAKAKKRLKSIPEMDEQTMLGEIAASMRGSNFYSQVLSFGGDSTKHWLELPKDVRTSLVKDDGEWMMHPRCEPTRLGDLETLWMRYASELAELRATTKEDDDTVDAHLATTIVDPVDTTFDDDKTAAGTIQRLTVALTIDFSRFYQSGNYTSLWQLVEDCSPMPIACKTREKA